LVPNMLEGQSRTL